MNRALLLLVAVSWVGCHDQDKSAPDAAPPPPVVPMGMASAAKLVHTTNAVEVLARVHHPSELALGGDQLYVVATESDAPDSDTDVLSLPTAPGGEPKVLYRAQRGAEGLAFAAGRLFWIVAPSDDKKEHAKILTAKLGAAPSTVARTYDLDETSAVSDGTDVFTFGDVKDTKADVLSADVLRVGASGKASRVAGAGPKPLRTALAVNATQVFWVQDDAIVRAPKAGGDPTAVAKVPGSKIQRLAADDGAVYWTDSGTGDPAWSGRVKRASLADGKVDTLSDAPSPLSVAVDADTVYWTSSADAGGRVLAQKKTGGATFVLAADLRRPRGLAIDGKYVYWVDAGDGGVCRTEKTPHPAP